MLWESQKDGIVRDPSFSPDGTQIAFVDGYCDSDHSVWVMNADGSNPRQIVPSETGPLSATHVYGLAWSPAGDRIALGLESTIYTFAPDGSGFTRMIAGKWPYWSPDGSSIRIGGRAWHPGTLAHGAGD